jgi:hypothetical protein
LVQVRVLFCVPPPHFLLHEDQAEYALQPPSTTKERIIEWIEF